MGGSRYSSVCGRALAYRFGYNYAFYSHHVSSQGIDDSYVDGLSLTHGFPGSRKHIWTFASGLFTGAIEIFDVLVIMSTPTVHLLLWAMTTFVRVFMLSTAVKYTSIQMLYSGMVRFVRVVAHAAT